MDNSKRPPHLKLVATPVQHPEPIPTPGQMRLFPADVPTSLIIADISLINEVEMLSLLCDTPPRWLIDLRPSPRFDIERLNRARVFTLFERHHIHYEDICGVLNIYSRRDASFGSGRVAAEVSRIFAQANASAEPGRVTVLVDDSEIARAMAVALPAQIHPSPRGGWATSIFMPSAALSWIREG